MHAESATVIVPFAESSIGDVLGIAITGMLIVFSALGLISLFLTLLPRITQFLAVYFPEREHGHALPESDFSDEGEIIAATGYVMHTELSHDA